MGYNYLYNWVIILPTELSAAAVLINFWEPSDKVNNAVWIVVCLVVVVTINMFVLCRSRSPTAALLANGIILGSVLGLMARLNSSSRELRVF